MTSLIAVPDVSDRIGITAHNLLGDLLNKLAAKDRPNRERDAYYDMHNMFKDLGIAIPPHLKNLEVAMGWPAKAVDELSRRVRLRSFVIPGGNVDDFGIADIWVSNRMNTEAPQTHTSALIHSTAFILTSQGDPSLGEPDVLMSTFSGLEATGIWDPARRALSSGLCVMARSDTGEPTRLLMLTPLAAADIRKREDREGWDVRAWRHGLGRVPLEPLTYRPRLGRPFGSSRISRSIMAITDSAVRTVARSEVGAEFFSAPQRYLLGADESAFVDQGGNPTGAWSLLMGRILAMPGNEPDGPKLEVGQFPQISMQPHTEQFRMWAAIFASEASLPLDFMGVVHDNPSSAEAINAAQIPLVDLAEETGENFGPAWVRSMATAVQIRDGLATLPPELRALDVIWRDPTRISKAGNTDAVMKQVQIGVLPPDSDVTLEQFGYDSTAIKRIQADRRRARSSEMINALAGVADGDA